MRKKYINIGEIAIDRESNNTENCLTYIINNKEWGIKSDGTDAINTTNGINNAIKWTIGKYKNIVLSKGTYLISGNNTITIECENMIFDFSNAILVKEPNGNSNYSITNLNNCKNVELLGGVIIGDRYTHDYSSGGSHEWGSGVLLTGQSTGITIKNFEIKDCTGDGILFKLNNYNQWKVIFLSNLTSGKLLENGNAVADQKYTVSNTFLPIPKLNDKEYISLMGNGYGAYGGGLNLDKTLVTFCFYDTNNNLLFTKIIRTYETIFKSELPEGVAKYRFSFRQNFNDIEFTTSSLFEIRGSTFIENSTVSNCEIHNCRRLGIAGAGLQNCVIENNHIHDINGTSPQYGIDIEDGYNLNQNIIIRQNKILNNAKGAIVSVSTRGLKVYDNILSGSVSLHGSRGEGYEVYNNIGDYRVTIKENSGGSLKLKNLSGLIINNKQFNPSASTIYENCVFNNVFFILDYQDDVPAHFVNCEFTYKDFDISGLAGFIIRKGNVIFQNCKFNLLENNSYLSFFRNENTSPMPGSFYKFIDCEINVHNKSIGKIQQETIEFHNCTIRSFDPVTNVLYGISILGKNIIINQCKFYARPNIESIGDNSTIIIKNNYFDTVYNDISSVPNYGGSTGGYCLISQNTNTVQITSNIFKTSYNFPKNANPAFIRIGVANSLTFKDNLFYFYSLNPNQAKIDIVKIGTTPVYLIGNSNYVFALSNINVTTDPTIKILNPPWISHLPQ